MTVVTRTIPGFAGEVITATDARYESARRVWNGYGLAGFSMCDDRLVLGLGLTNGVRVEARSNQNVLPVPV